MTHLYDSAWSNNIEHWRTLLNLFQDQIPKSDSFYAKIDYLNLPVRQEFSGTKPIRIEEIEEKIISKLTQNGHPIKDIHMRHFTDRYTLEVMRIRDKHIADGFIQFFVEFEKEESVWNLLPCEESLVDGSTTYDLKLRNGHGNSDIESLLDDDIMISRLSQAQYLEHINFEEEIEKFKGKINENWAAFYSCRSQTSTDRYIFRFVDLW